MNTSKVSVPVSGPVFRSLQGGDVGCWSVVENEFSATLLGIVLAEITYPDDVSFFFDFAKLERLEKKEIFRFEYLPLADGWAVDERDGPGADNILEEFIKQYRGEWERIQKVSDWLLSLSVREFKRTGLSSDLWP